MKSVNPQIEANKDLKANVLDNAGDILNELYYIYKEKYEEEKDALNGKDTEKFDYTKLRLSDDYEYESEEEEKHNDKIPDKKEPSKKPTETSAKELSKLVNKEETSMSRDLFQKHFSFDRPSALLRSYSRTKDTKNKELVDLTKI